MDDLNPTSPPRRSHRLRRGLWLIPVAGIVAAATGAMTTTAHTKQVAAQPTGLICDDGTLTGNERTFVLTARRGEIATPDGNTVPMWGFAPDNGDAYQYPSPFLCARADEQIKVVLHNRLGAINGSPLRTSIMFPGQTGVTADGVPGQAEFASGATTYTNTTGAPGAVRYTGGTGVVVTGGTLTSGIDLAPTASLDIAYDAGGAPTVALADGTTPTIASSTTVDTYTGVNAVVKMAVPPTSGGTPSDAYDIASGTDLAFSYADTDPAPVVTGVDGVVWVPAGSVNDGLGTITDTYTGVDGTVRIAGTYTGLTGGTPVTVYDVVSGTDLVVTHATGSPAAVTSAVDNSAWTPAASRVTDTYTNGGTTPQTFTVSGGTNLVVTGGAAANFYAVAANGTITVSYASGGAPTVTGVDGWGSVAGGTPASGLTSLAASIADGETITYSFPATHAGSYLYVSGTETATQQQMGLFGGLIIRTAAGTSLFEDDAATTTATVYGREFAQMLSDVDPEMHTEVNNGHPFDMANFTPRYWFINGRSMPDTIAPNNAEWLPAQPYTGLVNVLPYDPVKSGLDLDRNGGTTGPSYPPGMNASDYDQAPAAIRYFNASETAHPFHPHAADTTLFGVDGRPLGTNTQNHYVLEIAPGQTMDTTWRWIDVHDWNPTSNPIPVPTHDFRDTRFTGGATWYGGSPYLGVQDDLPTGTVTYNECGEYYHVAHSHAVNEATTYGAAMGGMLTLYRIDPPGKEGCK